jgi:hypothetical protein
MQLLVCVDTISNPVSSMLAHKIIIMSLQILVPIFGVPHAQICSSSAAQSHAEKSDHEFPLSLCPKNVVIVVVVVIQSLMSKK